MVKKLFVIFLFGLTSCINSGPKFSEGSGTSSSLFEPREKILTVQCYWENTQKTTQVQGMALDYKFRLPAVCSQRQQISEQTTSTRPLNIVFVIDLTASMQPSIDGIKNGIITLSRSLAANGWDAKYGAIGFRDEGAAQKIGFTDANGLFNALNQPSWQAAGGEDYQEAGQEAILLGLEHLKEQAQTRENAQNVVVYVSNAPAYRSGDKLNFDTSDLAQQSQALVQSIPDFIFYYSTDTRFLPDGIENTINAPMPNEQMHNFVKQVSFSNKELYYPITTSVLNEFSKEFIKVTHYRLLSCFLTSVELSSDANQGIPGKDKLSDIFEKVEQGELLSFQASPDPQTSVYTMKIDRCCKYLKDEPTCTIDRSSQIKWEFGK